MKIKLAKNKKIKKFILVLIKEVKNHKKVLKDKSLVIWYSNKVIWSAVIKVKKILVTKT